MSWEDWQTRGFSLWRLVRGHVGTTWAEGDCIFADERKTMLWFDRGLPVRDGDLGIWCIKVKGTEHRLGKYLLEVDGDEWLVSKEGAKRREHDDHVEGRVVMIIRDSERIDSSKAAEATRKLRANPPRRSDLVVFERDLFDLDEMRAAIRQHVASFSTTSRIAELRARNRA